MRNPTSSRKTVSPAGRHRLIWAEMKNWGGGSRRKQWKWSVTGGKDWTNKCYTLQVFSLLLQLYHRLPREARWGDHVVAPVCACLYHYQNISQNTGWVLLKLSVNDHRLIPRFNQLERFNQIQDGPHVQLTAENTDFYKSAFKILRSIFVW